MSIWQQYTLWFLVIGGLVSSLNILNLRKQISALNQRVAKIETSIPK